MMATTMTARRISKRRKVIIGLLAVLLLIYGGLRWFVYSLVYQPVKAFRSEGARPGHSFEDVYFTSSDGLKLNGWFFAAKTNSTRGRWAVLVCHGNGGNISYLESLNDGLLQTGANIMLFDYRGYGKSEGRPSEAGTYRDTRAAYQWLCQKGFAPTNIVVFGESLGGGMASELAMHNPLAGLVLESTYTSIPDMGTLLYPWLPGRLISPIRYDIHSRLPHLKIPVVVMHSRGDSLIPFELAARNYNAANEPKLLWEIKGEHAAGDARCRKGLEKLLDAIEAGRISGSNRVDLH
jgi:fermentation-respiration switch protein FrsA (DUF1100 family)